MRVVRPSNAALRHHSCSRNSTSEHCFKLRSRVQYAVCLTSWRGRAEQGICWESVLHGPLSIKCTGTYLRSYTCVAVAVHLDRIQGGRSLAQKAHICLGPIESTSSPLVRSFKQLPRYPKWKVAVYVVCTPPWSQPDRQAGTLHRWDSDNLAADLL